MSVDNYDPEEIDIEYQEESDDKSAGSVESYEIEEKSPLSIADNYPLLSREEELATAKLAREGDKEAQDKLVLHNMRLVRSYVMKKCDMLNQMDKEEAFLEGVIGLTEASQKFDPDRNTKFSTYATWWIKKHVSDYLLQKFHLGISEDSWIKFNKFCHVKNEIEEEKIKRGEKEYSATLNEIAERMSISPEKASELWHIFLQNNLTSLNQSSSNDEESLDLIDNITYSEEDSPEYHFWQDEANDRLIREINKLDDRHRLVIELTYGINGKPKLNTNKISEIMKVSPERVRQLIKESKKIILKDVK